MKHGLKIGRIAWSGLVESDESVHRGVYTTRNLEDMELLRRENPLELVAFIEKQVGMRLRQLIEYKANIVYVRAFSGFRSVEKDLSSKC